MSLPLQLSAPATTPWTAYPQHKRPLANCRQHRHQEFSMLPQQHTSLAISCQQWHHLAKDKVTTTLGESSWLQQIINKNQKTKMAAHLCRLWHRGRPNALARACNPVPAVVGPAALRAQASEGAPRGCSSERGPRKCQRQPRVAQPPFPAAGGSAAARSAPSSPVWWLP